MHERLRASYARPVVVPTEDVTVPCPHCGGAIKPAAKICKHCRAAIDIVVPSPREGAAALLKQAKDLHYSQNFSSAVMIYQRLVAEFPGTSEAAAAAPQIENLRKFASPAVTSGSPPTPVASTASLPPVAFAAAVAPQVENLRPTAPPGSRSLSQPAGSPGVISPLPANTTAQLNTDEPQQHRRLLAALPKSLVGRLLLVALVIAVIAAIVVLTRRVHKAGWVVREHKSEMTDEVEYSVWRESDNLFTNNNSIHAKKPKWRDRLVVNLYPELEVRLVLGYEPKAEFRYRLDGAPAETVTMNIIKSPPKVTFPFSQTFTMLLLRASTLKLQYQEIGGPERVETIDLAGLREAIEDVCGRQHPTFDCAAPMSPIRRLLEGGRAGTSNCTSVGLHFADLLLADPTTRGTTKLEVSDRIIANCEKELYSPSEVACMLKATSIAEMKQCAKQ